MGAWLGIEDRDVNGMIEDTLVGDMLGEADRFLDGALLGERLTDVGVEDGV